MDEIRSEIELIGIPSDKPLTLREAKRSFRRRSHQLLPEKSLGAQNAHSRFEELNSGFIKLLAYFRDSHGEDIKDLMPGEIDVKKNIFVITLRKGSVPHWKRVIKAVYPTVIIGAQKKQNFIPGAQGKGIRYVVYWKGGLEGGSSQIKVNLVLYENELLQVSGSGYFLWTMDNFQDMSQKVDESMNDAQRSDDEGVEVTEEFSESRGSSDTKEEPEEAECPVIRCPDAACLASKKFETILKYLGDIDEDLTSKCSDLKSYIGKLESGFSRQLHELSKTLEANEVKYGEDFKITQEKIAAINEKVVETRQIIAGASGSSKVSKTVTAVVAVEKSKQKLLNGVNGSSPKKTRKKSEATEAATRKVSKKQGSGEEEPGAKAKPLSRSSSPRKDRSSSRPSRSRSNSPRKPRNGELLSSIVGKPRSRSRQSSILNDGKVNSTDSNDNAQNCEEEDDDDYDTNGSSVSIDV